MKTQQFESVLHDWVHALPFQQQALLLTAMRGPDGLPKHNVAKVIVRFLRGAVIKPAGNWTGENNNDFMWGNYLSVRSSSGEWRGHDSVKPFQWWVAELWNDPDAYPFHFLMHLLHASEVVGYKHPDDKIRREWLKFYRTGVYSLHLQEESVDAMDRRLGDFGWGWHNANQTEMPEVVVKPFWEIKTTTGAPINSEKL
jgi:hypothetical protein